MNTLTEQLIEKWSKDPELVDVPYRRMALEAAELQWALLGDIRDRLSRTIEVIDEATA